MFVHGLRLLVALITFGVGIAASALSGSESPRKPPCGKRVASPEHVFVFKAQEEAPKVRPMAGHFFVDGGVLDGKALSKPQPVYPPAAKSADVKGTVAVFVRVDFDGRVMSAVATSGPAPLREAAEAAAYKATFAPTRLSGEPVVVRGHLTYNFGLE
ncbi:MAG TPA: energy transducer TonB [Pyrinomonadaceae bacterium]|jgi:TonB family protein